MTEERRQEIKKLVKKLKHLFDEELWEVMDKEAKLKAQLSTLEEREKQLEKDYKNMNPGEFIGKYIPEIITNQTKINHHIQKHIKENIPPTPARTIKPECDDCDRNPECWYYECSVCGMGEQYEEDCGEDMNCTFCRAGSLVRKGLICEIAVIMCSRCEYLGQGKNWIDKVRDVEKHEELCEVRN